MPSNHTKNYNLNQWERTDRVLMDDFNADNAKLDAAIKAQADALAAEKAAREAAIQAEASARTALSNTVNRMTGLHLIKTGTPLAQNAPTYEVDLSGIQWSQWKTVYLFLEMQGGTPIVFGPHQNSWDTQIRTGHSVMIFHPLYDENLPAAAFYNVGTNTSRVVSFGGNFKDVTSMYMYRVDDPNTPAIRAGTTYRVYGER